MLIRTILTVLNTWDPWPVQGDTELAVFLFTRMEKHLIGRSWSYETYVISLENYSHDEFSTIGIMEIRSVEVEKRSNYAGNG